MQKKSFNLFLLIKKLILKSQSSVILPNFIRLRTIKINKFAEKNLLIMRGQNLEFQLSKERNRSSGIFKDSRSIVKVQSGESSRDSTALVEPIDYFLDQKA